VSADGSAIAFYSSSTNLVAGDTNSNVDVFVRDRCVSAASQSHYGTGVAGTNGVPTITAASDPVLGSNLTVDLSNSAGRITASLLFVGFASTNTHSGLGGELLVIPALVDAVVIPAGGASARRTTLRLLDLLAGVGERFGRDEGSVVHGRAAAHHRTLNLGDRGEGR
jgi:hypothetical protein